jgi:hypothetical protein
VVAGGSGTDETQMGFRQRDQPVQAFPADRPNRTLTNTALRADIQSQMRNAFYCESPDWQAAVYGRAGGFISRLPRAYVQLCAIVVERGLAVEA